MQVKPGFKFHFGFIIVLALSPFLDEIAGQDQRKLQSLSDMAVLENPHRLDPPKPAPPKPFTRKETEKIINKKYPNRRAKQKQEDAIPEVTLHNVKEIQTLG